MRSMKKTMISVLIVGLFVIGSFATIGNGNYAGATNEIIKNLQFTTPSLTERTTDEQTYDVLTMDGAGGAFYHAGQPLLPMYATTYTLPFGTKITEVTFEVSEVQTMTLSTKILPAPQPVVQGMGDTTAHYTMDDSIYSSSSLFPATWFAYYTGGGLDSNNEHKTFITIQVYPIRYSPATDTLQYVQNGKLTITYEESQHNPIPATTDYALVIISPAKFSNDLQKLVDAKIGHGITTTLKTTEDIYDEFNGTDKPEQIKYFIKYAMETWGTKYILLVGGMDSMISGARKDDVNQGSNDWLVPVRYTNVREMGGVYDPGFISDLYYADIYDSEGNFSSWDSNHDGIFAKWPVSGGGRDTIDLFPDIAVGRLACRNKFEVKTTVNKIINYEKQVADSSWFSKMILVGGDSHDDSASTNINEGEYLDDYVQSHFMTEFTPVKIYASNNKTNPSMIPNPKNLLREISKGSGFLLFDGHGSPTGWNTHFPFNEGFKWVGGMNILHVLLLRNKEKLPITLVGGCHNSMFNNTLISSLTDADNTLHTWVYGRPAPEDFSWMLTHKFSGGSIATLGNTGLGYGTIGDNGDIDNDGINDPDCVEGLEGYQIRMFFKTYDEGTTILGDVWTGTMTKYLTTFPGMADQTDCKTVEQWPILGDPTLKIGGYAS